MLNFRDAHKAAQKADADKLRKRGYTVTFVTDEEFEDGVGCAPGWNCVKNEIWNTVAREVKDIGIKTPIAHWSELIDLGEHTIQKCSQCNAPAIYQKISDAGAEYVCKAHA